MRDLLAELGFDIQQLAHGVDLRRAPASQTTIG